MRVEIVGGGPAGLYSAILISSLARQYVVRVYERNPSNQFGGWGIILSKSTLANMRRADKVSHDRLQDYVSEQWRHIDVIRDNDALRVRSGEYVGLLRQDLLSVLSDRCQELGVAICFDKPISSVSDLASADFVIGADGLNSTVRTSETSFKPTFLTSESHYLWLGVSCELHNLKMIFKTYGDGYLVAQAYPSGRGVSTFVVECTKKAWQTSDLPHLHGNDVLDRLSDVFKNEICNQRLVSTDGARWRQFVTVHNPVWHSGSMVLLGDALHSIHFSTGSGTKLAVEDAMALCECLRRFESHGMEAVLDTFAKIRRSSCDAYQNISQSSYRWCEHLDGVMSLDIIPFTEHLLTRAGLYDSRTLALVAPEFSKVLREWKIQQGCGEA